MHDDDFGERFETGSVRFVRDLPGPIERVWAYLTESDKRARWLCGGKMELHEGGDAQFQFSNSALPDEPEPVPERYAKYEGIEFTGRVTRCEPPRLLQFTWPEESGADTEVTFELAEDGDRVRLVLTHRRLHDTKLMLGASAGWHSHLEVLAARLAGCPVTGFWSRHAALEDAYAKKVGE